MSAFTPEHRGGSGSPLVCLHGFADTWRTWELVLPALERRHEVLAPTLAGHAGGPPLEGEPDSSTLVDAVARAMDAAGMATAHLAGNSLGGWIALALAARGRARSVVALAPAGGWATGDELPGTLFALQTAMLDAMRSAAPRAPALLATVEGRRSATQYTTVHFEHIPAELLAHQMLGIASARGTRALLERAPRADWSLDAASIACRVRIVWGTEDRLLPWPAAAARYRREWLPHADWVVLDGVGHCPQLDVPVEAAQLILGFTAGRGRRELPDSN
jgi:pimeloyl-ACP methyl ester carboxylesterase